MLELCSVLSNDATDVTNHVVEVVHHRIDGDSNNPNAAVRKDLCSEFVLLSLPLMMRPVDLHGQMNGGTIEVGDGAGDDVLSAKFQSVQLAATQA